MLLLALALFLQLPTSGSPNAIRWYYEDADAINGGVEVFLVCLDGQPTSACTKVPVTANVTAINGVPVLPTMNGQPVKHYLWKFPPLLVGKHTVAVQSCDAALDGCSDGVTDTFTIMVAKAEVKGLQRVEVR